jgi:glycosyltransferase involved in cell wall biosynthesis
MDEKLDISVVVPAYNEEESIPELTNWISRVMESHGFHYEVLIIDDGSTDQTWEVVKNLEPGLCVSGLRFNRNYGKSAALDAGFEQSQGRVVITMDADLQDSPDEIPGLYKQLVDNNLDLVSGWKKKRHDPIGKTIPSRFFNFITRMISGIRLHDFNCGLKAYRLQVVKNIFLYGEMHRYIPVLAKWSGFGKIGEKVVVHQSRKYGKTKFGIERFMYGFLDLLSITFVFKFKKRPMHFFGTWGTISFLFGMVFTTKIIWDKVNAIYFLKTPVNREITDQPLFFLALVAIVIGIQLFLAGFLGELLALQEANKKEYHISEKT